MALVQWEPRNRFFDLRNEIDRLFDRFWQRSDEADEFLAAAWHPSVDVEERDDAYVVTADLPGMSRGDIKVQMANNVLTLSGERKSEKKDEKYHRTERTYGRFSRSFSLPSSVDENGISATYKDGVLAVTLPKAEEAKAKLVEIK